MRIRSSSSSPPALSLGPLPPTPIASAATPVHSPSSSLPNSSSLSTPTREPTPFDELPMSHLISFPLIDSPTSPDSKHHHHHDQSFEAFNSIQNPFSAFHGSSALLRDAFDYYRLPNSNPTPISDALNMSLHGSAFKAQLHSIHDISSALSFQHQHQHQPCIPTAQLFPATNNPASSHSSQITAASPSPISPLILPVTSSPSAVDDQCNSPLFSEAVGQIVIPPSTTTSNPSSSSPTSQSHQSSKKRPPRATISTKDFVPPDVSGLSKREARLVKNRAAAFLSRQRKREEFECMELRVAQLEQENARLLSLTQQYSSPSRSPSPAQPSSKHPKTNPAEPSDPELSNLRGLLAESRSRTAELEKELQRLRSNAASSPSPSSESGSELGSPARGAIQIKRETAPPEVVPRRTGASLFGVVLLCALPSLLSLPAPIVPHAASRFSFTPGPGSVNHQPHRTESLLDWSGMDIDDDASGSRRKVNLPLSFLNSQNDLLQQNFMNGGGPDLSLLSQMPPDFEAGSEAEFDVSFMASPNEGKIRVRIETPSSSAPALASSSSSSSSTTSGRTCPMAGSSPLSPPLDSPSFAHSSPSDSWDLDFSAPDHAAQGFMWDSPSAAPAGANVDLSIFASEGSATSSTRRRVRIALKNGPVAGAEGGEWEVEVC